MRASHSAAVPGTKNTSSNCACGGGCPRCQSAGQETQDSPAPLHPSLTATLAAPGVPLQPAVRTSFEKQFQCDLSHVRLHADETAARSARAIEASAFNYGAHIVLGDEYHRRSPAAQAGLLAHELSHVVESRGMPFDTRSLQVETDPSAEARADSAGHNAMSAQAPFAATRGNVAARIRRQPAQKPAPKPAIKYPATIQVGSEFIEVANAAEDKEARKLIQEIQTEFGISLNSSLGKTNVQNSLVGDPDQPQSMSDILTHKPKEKIKDLIKTSSWTVPQLRDLKKGLGMFAPVLGPRRALTNMLANSSTPQPITSVSRVTTGVETTTTPTGTPVQAATPNVLGEFFSVSDNASFFDSAPTNTKFADRKKAFLGVVVHEIAHALMPADLFLTGLSPAYWKDATTPTGDTKAEQPITSYGGKSAREDMAEATMFFFVEPTTLKSKCPQRYVLVEAAKNRLFNPPQKPGPKP